MKDQPVRTLKKLVRQYGRDLVADSRRTEALLNDFCPAYRREVFLLVNAQRQQVPADLIASPTWMPYGAASTRLSRRLQERLGFSAEAADWAVDSWSIALGLQNNPSRTARLLGKAHSTVFGNGAHRQPQRKEVQSGHIEVQSASTPSASTPSTSTVSASTVSASPVSASTVRQPHKDVRSPYNMVSAARPAQIAGRGASALEHVRGIAPNALRRLAGLAAFIASCALLWAVVATTPAGEVATALVTQARSPALAMRRVYPVPRYAWVSEGPLLVREGPSMSRESIAMLAAGESVQVSGYSADMQWSHIVEPTEGWVSNWYLYFVSSDDATSTVRLLHQEMTAVDERVAVFSAPVEEGDPIAILDPGAEAVAMAVTADGQWRHIVSPVVGWVASDGLAIQ